MANGHSLFAIEQELTLALEHELRTRGVILNDSDDVDVGNRFVVELYQSVMYQHYNII